MLIWNLSQINIIINNWNAFNILSVHLMNDQDLNTYFLGTFKTASNARFGFLLLSNNKG